MYVNWRVWSAVDGHAAADADGEGKPLAAIKCGMNKMKYTYIYMVVRAESQDLRAEAQALRAEFLIVTIIAKYIYIYTNIHVYMYIYLYKKTCYV